jgi:predicted DNA binding CopG/RHH family protein
MTVTIEISDEQVAALQVRAAAKGLSLQDWLRKLATEEIELDQAVQVGLWHAGKVRPGAVG